MFDRLPTDLSQSRVVCCEKKIPVEASVETEMLKQITPNWDRSTEVKQQVIFPSLVTSENWPSGKDGRLVIWGPCRLGGSNPTVDKIFCNVHLFRVPLSWTGGVQMKSSMTVIRGNRCIERETYFQKWPRSKTFKGVHTSFNSYS